MKTPYSITIKPQYVRLTRSQEMIDGELRYLHEVQRKIKEEFDQLSEFSIITAPTGTGKSYAFPFPALGAKKQTSFYQKLKVRGLIVLPTNALIEELHTSFSKTYPSLRIEKINGTVLNQWELKGFDRWKKTLELAEGCDLAITNPDIINYAMHGGYHKNFSKAYKGLGSGAEIHQFLAHFQYIIFDEYHLYDEAQIANLLTLVYLRNVFLRENAQIKYLFVSATPEEGLKQYLKESGQEYQEIIEEIVDQSEHARAIHGELKVHFHKEGIQKVIDRCKDEIEEELRSGRRVLIILNKLRDVQELTLELQKSFPFKNIYQSSGYINKQDDQSEKIKAAHIIVATNKAEVGVNYNVEYCIMEPGKYFQNFIQRFGRVSRNDKPGTIHVCLHPLEINKLKKAFHNTESVAYYQFFDFMRKVLQGKSFYHSMIPMYMGEYIWCIEKNVKEHQVYEIRQVLKEQLNKLGFFTYGKAYSRYKALDNVDQQVQALLKAYPKGPKAIAWSGWWKRYRDTYLKYRDGGLNVKIVDEVLELELEYSLEWILQHKEIHKIEVTTNSRRTTKTYYVGNLKKRDKELQYTIATLPNVDMEGNKYVSYQDLASSGFNWKMLFKDCVELIKQKVRKQAGGIADQKLMLLNSVKELSVTFNRNRLDIEEIVTDNKFL